MGLRKFFGPVIMAVSPASLPAGQNRLSIFRLPDSISSRARLSVGFGTTDVVVRRVFVLGPNHLQADVSVVRRCFAFESGYQHIFGFPDCNVRCGFPDHTGSDRTAQWCLC